MGTLGFWVLTPVIGPSGLSPRTSRASLPMSLSFPDCPVGTDGSLGSPRPEVQGRPRSTLAWGGRGRSAVGGAARRWAGPGLANQERGECVALWPEVFSYSWCRE